MKSENIQKEQLTREEMSGGGRGYTIGKIT